MRHIAFTIAIVLFHASFVTAQKVDPPPYDLNNPDALSIMPDYLEEVSGLTYYAPFQLAMHDDERGRMYVYDISTKEIIHRIRFEGKGDFEAIERIGESVFVVRSDGKLFRFNVNMEGVVEEIKTPFDKKNDVERLGYDQKGEYLLFALKEDGDTKGVSVSGKAIYGYHLPTKTFKKMPLYHISDKSLRKVVGDSFKFKPSAIAQHPITDEIYVLSSNKPALLVFDYATKKPLSLTKLIAKFHPQPEGIAFMPNGDLFIANEGEDEGGTLLFFKMKK